ncbi:M67 family metallopeptidase [Qipengyuania sp. 6B39]|uniref:Mov34/MPN/PAD-1 family protein n=1 Tax=Qipengyuania proteolytica TaxID=2867239 RepID=UPI001C892602|nr:M67 family metallopeptidase [Qipengyuania proteolytica]MBX7496807.1 M67 family metallopeptidase [Qipengyuania proteolytica]
MTLEVSSAVIDSLLAAATRAHPLECCGILLGTDRTISASEPAANVHPQPATQFEIDPQVLIDAHRVARKGGPQVVGYYHSHPNGRSEPSATDAAMAARDGMVWAIVAAGRVSFWRFGDAGFDPLPYVATPR